ncbi:MAG: tagatose 1,6-diphosphate aldolase [Candidatus Aenigmatarchaeota archaeon]
MGLEKISSNGIFQIVALDHRNSLRKIINPRKPESVEKEVIEEIKLKFSKVFSSQASGILLDPIYGKFAIQAVKGKCGILISLEDSGYEETEEGRINKLIENFGPEKVLEMGGDAAKLLVYFNPKAKTAKNQKDLIKNVAEECEKINLPLVCEFLVYPYKEKNFEKERSELIIKSVKEISKLGISVLKVEFPGDVKKEKLNELEKKCKKISKVSSVPWVLLSKGKEFDEFKNQLKIAMQFGCSGFMVGRALWQDYFKVENKEDFLKSECMKRLEELKSIASKKFISE